MRMVLTLGVSLFVLAATAEAQKPPLLPEKDVAALVAERLRAYGLSEVAILQFPADGKIFYGTQRSRPAWDAEKGELWEVAELFQEHYTTGRTTGVTVGDKWKDVRLIGSYGAEPIVLAEESE